MVLYHFEWSTGTAFFDSFSTWVLQLPLEFLTPYLPLSFKWHMVWNNITTSICCNVYMVP